jgi:hypothetical protein
MPLTFCEVPRKDKFDFIRLDYSQLLACRYGNCFGAAAKFNEVLFNSHVKQSHLLNQGIRAMDLKFGRNCKNANRLEAYAPSRSFEFNDERAEILPASRSVRS